MTLHVAFTPMHVAPGRETIAMAIIVVVFFNFLYILLLQVDDISAQTSCVISPDLTTLTLANALGRDVEFHCQCMDSNGMMVTGTRWYHNGSIVATQNAVTPSFTVPYQINTTPITLYINAPFTTDHSHTGTYTCSPNSMSFASPPGDTITLNAARPTAPRVCNIYSPNVTTNGALMDIPSGTQNVILYCICRRTNVAVGPTTWYINGVQVTRTQASGDNPYYRNNVPSPLIIPTFTATHAGTYGCGGLIVRDGVATVPTIPNVIIHLDISAIQPPTNVKATVLTPRSVEVTWTMSSSPDVIGYIISYTTTASYTSCGSVSVNQRTTIRGTLSNLEESTTYTITVQATTIDNRMSVNITVLVTTYSDVPSSAPQNVIVTSVNRASLRVSWQSPPVIDHNGPITYMINYTRGGTSNMMNVNSGTTHIISGLVTNVDYSVTVAARTVNGTGPFSDPPVVGKSGEDAPTPPRSLMIVDVIDTTVTLSWMSPVSPNGIIINYRVQYKRSDSSSPDYNSIDTMTADLTYTVTGLTTNIEYDFRVRADTRAGHSDPSNVVTTFVDASSDGSSDDNNGVNIVLAVLAISVIGLVISIVINVFLVIKLKQSRYDVNQESRDNTITDPTNKYIKTPDPEYEAIDTKPNMKPHSDVKMDVNPAYQATN